MSYLEGVTLQILHYTQGRGPCLWNCHEMSHLLQIKIASVLDRLIILMKRDNTVLSFIL